MRKWLYYILDEMSRSARIEGGLLQFKSDPKPVVYTPTGWRDISIAWERNLQKHGAVRSFTLPRGFVLDGADILRNIRYNYGIEKKIWVLINRQSLFIDESEFYFLYDYFYMGQVDWTTGEDSEDGYSVQLIEGGRHKDLSANQDTTYEFTLDDPEAISVRMDGIEIFQSAEFIVTNGLLLENNAQFGNHNVNLISVGSENKNMFIQGVERERLNTVNQNQLMAQKELWFYRNSLAESRSIEVEWNFKMRATLAPGIPANPAVQLFLSARKLFKDGTTADDATVLQSFSGPSNVYRLNTFSGTATITNIPAGSDVYLFMGINIIGPSGDQVVSFDYNNEDGFFNIKKSSYLFPATEIKVIPAYVLFQRLVKRMTGVDTAAVSSLLQRYMNLCLTSGTGIRGLENAKIKTKYADFTASIDAVLCTGSGIIQDKVVIEEREYFYRQDEIIPLGRVKDPKQKSYNEIIINLIKVGYPPQNYDDVNGRTEFNTTFEWSTPIQGISRTLDIVSKYRADCYGIEFLRANLEGKDTTDNEGDNEVFWINVDYENPVRNDDGDILYYNLKRETYDTLEGVLTPTVFNLADISPRRMLERHLPWLKGIFYSFGSDKFQCTTSDKNRDLKTVKGSVTVDEDGDISISSITGAYIKAEQFTFETPYYSNLPGLLLMNPNRCFSFVHPRNDLTYKGHIMKIGVAPDDNQPQQFILLSTFDNDLKTLINVN